METPSKDQLDRDMMDFFARSQSMNEKRNVDRYPHGKVETETTVLTGDRALKALVRSPLKQK